MPTSTPAMQEATAPVSDDSFLRHRMGTAARFSYLFPLAALIYVCLIFAPEAAVTVAGVNLTAYRVAILLMIVPAIIAFIRGPTSVSVPDLLFVGGTMWVVVAFLNLFDPGEGFVRALGIVVDVLGGYLIGRVSIRSFDDLRRVLIIVAPGFLIAGVVLAIESITHTIIYRTAFASVFGSGAVYAEGNFAGAIEYRTDSRLGLMRAYSTFSHPILAGLALGSLLPLYVMSGIRSWPFWSGLTAAFLGFFSLSSATVLILLVAIAMLGMDKVKRYFRYVDWRVLTFAAFVLLLLVHIASQSGVAYVIIRYTFDPHNGYVRIIQWEAALEALKTAPWFGIGYQRVPQLPDWLPSSIDTHLLALALRSGWITAVAFYLAPLWIIASLGLAIDRFPPRDRNLVVGYNIAIFVILLGSLTVTLFGETNIYVMAMLGAGASLAQIPVARSRVIRAHIVDLPSSPPRQERADRARFHTDRTQGSGASDLPKGHPQE